MRLLLLIISTLILSACGGSDTQSVNLRQSCDPASPIIGLWEDMELNGLEFGSDCFGRTYDACDLRFGYYKPDGGQILLEVNSTNGGPSCPPLGENTCSFQHNNDPMNEHISVNCGQGNIIYLPK